MDTLDLLPDRALFDGKVDGLVIACYEDERPLRGLAGLIDWRFEGLISSYLRSGAITGKPGECAYVPAIRTARTFHFLLVGAGHVPSAERRRKLFPAESLKPLRKNLDSLKLSRLGISREDCGLSGDARIPDTLKELPTWLLK